jgi:flagellar biosynthesis protein FlhG
MGAMMGATDQGATLRLMSANKDLVALAGDRGLRSLAITSGKGGVGKTSIAANLAFVLAGMGVRVLVLDADMGLANIDVLLGLSPQRTLRDFLSGTCDLREVLLEGPNGMHILPSGSGLWELTHLSREQRLVLMSGINDLKDEHDLLLIDTAAGVSPNVLHFNATAEEVLVVVTPDPPSITDAYALIKLMFTRYRRRHFLVVVNGARNGQEAGETFRGLNGVVERFLHLSLTDLGSVPCDPAVARSVRSQRPFADLYPSAKATQSLEALARRLLAVSPRGEAAGEMTLFGPYA